MFDEELLALAQMVVSEFVEAGFKIATVESCTGGLIGGCITAVSGSSAVFDRGFLTYSNDAKIDLVNVAPATLEEHGAVSAECASQMATGAIAAADVDASVAVTGIAGPGGGTDEKPVGLVFIAVATAREEGAFVERFEFGDIGRDQVRRETIREALEMLLGYGIDGDDEAELN
ncbi:MAG: CinA family protein [Rhizobiaceae bacterium]|nr:CinA family protein [Rhizobiaceae bacterium]